LALDPEGGAETRVRTSAILYLNDD
jgi:hypothetical protein